MSNMGRNGSLKLTHTSQSKYGHRHVHKVYVSVFLFYLSGLGAAGTVEAVEGLGNEAALLYSSNAVGPNNVNIDARVLALCGQTRFQFRFLTMKMMMMNQQYRNAHLVVRCF